MMTDEQIKDLLRRYREGLCTGEEKSAVEAWYEQQLNRSGWDFQPGEESIIRDRIKARLENGMHQPISKKVAPLHKIFRYAAAAVILLAVVSGIIVYRRSRVPERLVSRKELPERLPEAMPGGSKAVLTLANGTHIELDSNNTGVVAQQGSTQVIRLGKGEVTYQGNTTQKQPVYNTLTTPRGGKYQLVLPDGSKVWLNAASSITFPTSFAQGKRVVQITGEAYFEIARSASAPFEVSAGTMKILVLGTHFNVMAYGDETGIQTTLLEGSVKVERGDTAFTLKPGEQATLNNDGRIRLLRDVNEDKIIAWKNDLFCFDHDDIQSVMHQLSRWYDLDVVIEGNITAHFSGTLPQNVNASEIFKVLEETSGIHFTPDNQKIIVSP